MTTEIQADEGDRPSGKTSTARGGPVFFPSLVGSLAHPPTFRNHLLHALQDLKVELLSDSPQLRDSEEDLSVDDLKVFTDAELVDMALKEAFKDNGSAEEMRKRQRADHSITSVCLENAESDLARVDNLVQLKNKQDQDRQAARFHALSSKKHERAVPSESGVERMKSLMSADSLEKPMKSVEFHEHSTVQPSEVVLCVEIYDTKYKRGGVKTQEFLVLGCQLLTEMRDMIDCSTDKKMNKAEQHDPSGYFLVEDVFYNDLRSSAAIDYSEPIFDWLKNSKDDAQKKWESIISGELKAKQKDVVGEVMTPQLPQFRHAEMHKTRFSDLKLRLGAGYLYCHQGDCKHTIIFRDMRMIHPEDEQNRAAYPIAFRKKYRVQKCSVCGICTATKVTVNDKWAKFSPCYFCRNCYFYLHYTEDGSLLYNDFSVYDCA